MLIDHVLSQTCTKVKSKWIKHINIKTDTLNLAEKKVATSLECIGTGDKKTPIMQALRLKTNKWDSMKLTNFFKVKYTVS